MVVDPTVILLERGDHPDNRGPSINFEGLISCRRKLACKWQRKKVILRSRQVSMAIENANNEDKSANCDIALPDSHKLYKA